MPTRIADEYASIRNRMREIENENKPITKATKQLNTAQPAGAFARIWWNDTAIQNSKYWKRSDNDRTTDDFADTVPFDDYHRRLLKQPTEVITHMANLAYLPPGSYQYRKENISILAARMYKLNMF